MIKNLILLSITILLFGCKQNEEKSTSIDTGTSNNKLITLNDSIKGSGEVFCKGNPSKQMTKVTGSGDITEKD